MNLKSNVIPVDAVGVVQFIIVVLLLCEGIVDNSVVGVKSRELHGPTKNTTNTTKALAELAALLTLVSDKLEGGTEVTVVGGKVLSEGHALLDLEIHTVGSDEVTRVLGLLGAESLEGDLTSLVVEELKALVLEVLPHKECLDGTHFESHESFLDTEANLTGILSNFVEEVGDELLLLDELNVSESILSKLNCLVETIFTTVGNINKLNDNSLKTRVKEIRTGQDVLELGGTSENNTLDVGPVVSDKASHSSFSTLADVVVPLLETQTCKTKSRLTTTAVLLGEIDGELGDHLTSVTGKSTEETSVTIHHDETKLVVVREKLLEGLSVEAVITHVQGCVDGLERLEINTDLLFLALISEDGADKKHKAVGGALVIQLEALLGTCDCTEHREPVHTGFDVGGSTGLIGKHLVHLCICVALGHKWVNCVSVSHHQKYLVIDVSKLDFFAGSPELAKYQTQKQS